MAQGLGKPLALGKWLDRGSRNCCVRGKFQSRKAAWLNGWGKSLCQSAFNFD